MKASEKIKELADEIAKENKWIPPNTTCITGMGAYVLAIMKYLDEVGLDNPQAKG